MPTRVGEAEGPARRYVPPEGTGTAADAAERVERAAEEARRQGFEKGLAEGREQARREATERLDSLGASIEAMTRFRSELIHRAERDILRLAVKIAEVVVRERVGDDGEVAARSLKAALEQVPAGERFTVRCHPDDRPALAARLEKSPSGVEHALEADPGLTQGGCVVKCAAGEIDVRVETQLKIIEHELLERS